MRITAETPASANPIETIPISQLTVIVGGAPGGEVPRETTGQPTETQAETSARLDEVSKRLNAVSTDYNERLGTRIPHIRYLNPT